MAGRLDPPHDRVTLTLDELCALARLEHSFAHEPYRGPESAVAARDAPARLRSRALAVCLRWVRIGPWLVPIGIVVMLVALPLSLLVSAIGAMLTGFGFATCVRRPWARAPIVHWRGRRHRRRDGAGDRRIIP